MVNYVFPICTKQSEKFLLLSDVALLLSVAVIEGATIEINYFVRRRKQSKSTSLFVFFCFDAATSIL